MRNEIYNIVAAYKVVDTCAAEFDAQTPYYYSTYGGENESVETNPPKKVHCTWFRSYKNWTGY